MSYWKQMFLSAGTSGLKNEIFFFFNDSIKNLHV